MADIIHLRKKKRLQLYDTKGVEIFYVDGIKFHLEKATGYYGGYINKGCRKIRLHRYIWEKYHGAIPKGYHVHHIDKNKFNNNIENLVLLSSSEHEKLHETLKTEEEIQNRKKKYFTGCTPKGV